MLNVHASLLPKYRGASPIIHAIRNGDAETGVSIMRIEPKKFDIGDVLATRRTRIPANMLMPELHDHLAQIGADLMIDCIKRLDQCEAQKQDESKSSYGETTTVFFSSNFDHSINRFCIGFSSKNRQRVLPSTMG